MFKMVCCSAAFAAMVSLWPVAADESSVTRGKILNVNPDPNGQPWYVGGVPQLTPEALKRMEAIPLLDFSKRRVCLPDMMDNSKLKYFRPIFNQQGGSCSQASGIGYQFTYEVNYIRNTAANSEENQFPSHYTWNFLNEGLGWGSWTTEGWGIINANGCPTVADFGGMFGRDSTSWMTGYDKYYRSMVRRCLDIRRIKLSTADGIATLKQWICDRGDGSQNGSLANFTVFWVGLDSARLAPGTPEEGKLVITKWGTEWGHALTIVGYNDSVRYDFNHDGQYTNTLDIDNDGTVGVTDWEKGAFIVANSFGTEFGDQGFLYMPYRLCALPQGIGGLSQANNVFCLRATESYKPKLTYKIALRHNRRGSLKFIAGVAGGACASEPDYTYSIPIFNYQGGQLPMQGVDAGEEIELGIDITPLLSAFNTKTVKLFFIVHSLAGTGAVQSFSMYDCRTTPPVERVCTQQNVEIRPGSTTMSIVYISAVNDVKIKTDGLPTAQVGKPYCVDLTASGGKRPYIWAAKTNGYSQEKSTGSFPEITANILTPYNLDDGYAEQTIGFDFPFYGNTYNKIYMSTDGSLLFAPVYTSVRTPVAIPGELAISPLGADLMFENPGDYLYYDGDATKAIFRWKTTKFWGKEQRVNLDFAVTLFPSGEFHFQYNKDLTDSCAGLAHGFSAGNYRDYCILDEDNTSLFPDYRIFKFKPLVMPDGMTITDRGILKGIPQSAGSFPMTVVCTDANGSRREKTLCLTVSQRSTDSEISDRENNGMPKIYMLGSRLLLMYRLQKQEKVRCSIMNLQGRIIQTLTDEIKGPGTYTRELVFGARGLSAAQGMYVVTLNAGERELVQRIVHLK